MKSRPLAALLVATLALLALGAWAAAGESEGARAAAITLRVMALAACLIIGAGLAAALLLARWRSPLRPFAEALLLAPLVLPPTVTGFGLAMLLGKNGPLGFLGLVFNWQAAAIAAAVVSFPLFLRAARPALSMVDDRQTMLARSLGASPGEILLRITLPLAAPGLLAGTALALGRALGEFGATMILAGNIPGVTRTLPLAVYAAFAEGDEETAFVLSSVLVGIAVALVGASALLEGSSQRPSKPWRQAPQPIRRTGGATAPSDPAAAFVGAIRRTGSASALSDPAAAFVGAIRHPDSAAARLDPPAASAGGGLSIRGLRARAGGFELGSIDLDLPAGCHAALLGPSGAGKSTLLRALTGGIPASGRVLLGGDELLGQPPERRGIGLVPQGGLLFPHLDCISNVAFGLPRLHRRERAAAALAAVGAAHLACSDPRDLSGGETMRVSLARAIACRPRLLLLDEPLAALDPASREELLPLLASLPTLLGGAPILHVTHDFEEAFRVAGYLAVLLDGRIAAAGAPDRIFARPPSAEIAAFLRVDNLLAGSFERLGAGASLFRRDRLAVQVAGDFEGEGWIAFDGSALLLCEPPLQASSARNAFVAEVNSITPLQRGLLVSLRVEGVELRARITHGAREALALASGVSIGVLLKATAPQVLRALKRVGPA